MRYSVRYTGFMSSGERYRARKQKQDAMRAFYLATWLLKNPELSK